MKAKKANLCGKQITLARIEMHQVELAAAISVDCGIERGTRKVSDIELDAFAKILRKSVIWILYGEKGELKR